MAPNLEKFLLVTLSVCFLLSGVYGSHGPLLGAYQPIDDLTDPALQEIGKFAVAEHNKQAETNLVYEKVVKGEKQVVAGMNYRLVVEAKDGDDSKHYQVVVYERAWENFRNLTSFREIND